jgi:hypothetical protein
MAETTVEVAPQSEPPRADEPKGTRRIRFSAALTALVSVLLFVWVASCPIQSGVHAIGGATAGVVMGGLALAKIGCDRYLRIPARVLAIVPVDQQARFSREGRRQ